MCSPGAYRTNSNASAKRANSNSVRHARQYGELRCARTKSRFFRSSVNVAPTTRPRSCRLAFSRRAEAANGDVRERRSVASASPRAPPRAASLAASIPESTSASQVRSRTASRGSRNTACVTTARAAEDHAEIFLFAPCRASSSRGAGASFFTEGISFFIRAVSSGTLPRAFSSPRVDAAAPRPRSEAPRSSRAPNENERAPESSSRRSSTSFASDDARARERSATRRDETRRATSDARARASDAEETCLGERVFVFVFVASDGPSDASASETEAWETSSSSEAARAGIGRTSPPARGGRVTPVRSFGVCPRAGAAARAAGRDDCPSTRMSRCAFSSASRPA
jgi:hypothetical protein